MTNTEFNIFTTCLKALANLPNADEQIQLFIKNYIPTPTSFQEDNKVMSDTNKASPATLKKRNRRGRPALLKNTFKLSTKELLSMPNKIQKIFVCGDKLISYRYHKGVFEAHYRRNGLNIYASSKDFQEMKRKFLILLANAEPTSHNISSQEYLSPVNKPDTIMFMDYVQHWLDGKKVTVKASTYAEYERLCHKNLKASFGDKTLSEMTRTLLQEYLFQFVNEGKARTAQKLHLVLSCIFDLVAEDLDIKNPMNKIELPYHESKKGSAFTTNEERELVNYCIRNPDAAASSALLVLLYFGLRQSELAGIVIENDTLTCKTSKQLKGRIEVTRSIPFTPMAKKVLPYIDFKKAKATKQRTIASAIHRLFPHHHPHELRYTFITRCKECGVNPEVVMLWDGHSFDKDVKTTDVDRGYTDYSKEYLQKEALKVDYKI